MSAAARPSSRDWPEILATVLLALAAVATAWSSYQAARWNGEQAKAAGRVNAVRVEAARAQGLAEAQTEVDVATFIEWVDASVHDDAELTAFYEARFREEFKPAFDAWLATEPLTTVEAPPTPFAMEEYQLAAEDEAATLDAEAEQLAADVRRNILRSTNYVLGVVMFAVVLFFAGMSTKLQGRGVRHAMLAMGTIVFLGAAIRIATFPVSVVG
jgi:ferric-dicitrate binding protein FerR (iron transport regulator)